MVHQLFKLLNTSLSKMQSRVRFLFEIKTRLAGTDNFFNFPCKMSNSNLKELSNMSTKKI